MAGFRDVLIHGYEGVDLAGYGFPHPGISLQLNKLSPESFRLWINSNEKSLEKSHKINLESTRLMWNLRRRELAELKPRQDRHLLLEPQRYCGIS